MGIHAVSSGIVVLLSGDVTEHETRYLLLALKARMSGTPLAVRAVPGLKAAIVRVPGPPVLMQPIRERVRAYLAAYQQTYREACARYGAPHRTISVS